MFFKSLDGGTGDAVQSGVQSVAEQVVLSQIVVGEATISRTEVNWDIIASVLTRKLDAPLCSSLSLILLHCPFLYTTNCHCNICNIP